MFQVGILGPGVIAEKMAGTIACMNDAVCCAVASRSLERAQVFAEKFSIPRAYGSYDALATDPEVQLVYIATPHTQHYACAKLCLEHGKPVLCEKPFTVNAAQAEELLALAKEKGVFITEAMWTRYMPSRRIIDEMLAAGEIGEVVGATANLCYDIQNVPRLRDPALAGGALLDVGVYPLAFLAMVLGSEIEEVISTCTMLDTGVDATNAVILKMRGGKMGIAHSGILGGSEQAGIVYGTKGYLIAENINDVTAVQIYDNDRNLVRAVQMPPQITGFEDQVRASMHAIAAGKIECPELPHQEILRMMRLLDQIRGQWGLRYPCEG